MSFDFFQALGFQYTPEEIDVEIDDEEALALIDNAIPCDIFELSVGQIKDMLMDDTFSDPVKNFFQEWLAANPDAKFFHFTYTV